MESFFELTNDVSSVSVTHTGEDIITLTITDIVSNTSNGIILTPGQAHVLVDVLYSYGVRDLK